MPPDLEGLIFTYFFAENRILGCLGGILEASWAVLAKFLGRLGSPRRLQDAPKSARIGPKRLPRGVYKVSDVPRHRQDALRCLQDGPRGLQDGPRELQERPKLPQEAEIPSKMDKDISATKPS